MEKQEKSYRKPEVKGVGTSPEPVESGCCLTSCGGSPGITQNNPNVKKGDADVVDVVESALSDIGK
ncbi:MAG: hypothetical protein U9P50_01265 [Patescibacteria group bacterium]|nr:hypothetical protein [Patescibacteria group bacterium]